MDWKGARGVSGGIGHGGNGILRNGAGGGVPCRVFLSTCALRATSQKHGADDDDGHHRDVYDNDDDGGGDCVGSGGGSFFLQDLSAGGCGNGVADSELPAYSHGFDDEVGLCRTESVHGDSFGFRITHVGSSRGPRARLTSSIEELKYGPLASVFGECPFLAERMLHASSDREHSASRSKSSSCDATQPQTMASLLTEKNASCSADRVEHDVHCDAASNSKIQSTAGPDQSLSSQRREVHLSRTPDKTKQKGGKSESENGHADRDVRVAQASSLNAHQAFELVLITDRAGTRFLTEKLADADIGGRESAHAMLHSHAYARLKWTQNFEDATPWILEDVGSDSARKSTAKGNFFVRSGRSGRFWAAIPGKRKNRGGRGMNLADDGYHFATSKLVCARDDSELSPELPAPVRLAMQPTWHIPRDVRIFRDMSKGAQQPWANRIFEGRILHAASLASASTRITGLNTAQIWLHASANSKSASTPSSSAFSAASTYIFEYDMLCNRVRIRDKATGFGVTDSSGFGPLSQTPKSKESNTFQVSLDKNATEASQAPPWTWWLVCDPPESLCCAALRGTCALTLKSARGAWTCSSSSSRSNSSKTGPGATILLKPHSSVIDAQDLFVICPSSLMQTSSLSSLDSLATRISMSRVGVATESGLPGLDLDQLVLAMESNQLPEHAPRATVSLRHDGSRFVVATANVLLPSKFVYTVLSDHESLPRFVNDVVSATFVPASPSSSSSESKGKLLSVHQTHSFLFFTLDIRMLLRVVDMPAEAKMQSKMISGDMKRYETAWNIESFEWCGLPATRLTFELCAAPKLPAPNFILDGLGKHGCTEMLKNVRSECFERWKLHAANQCDFEN
ncbi:hypothetical protein FVE85_8623 [Porphyridium purpureum]|uniref:Coenzyme Q-binding protein COQ10 START domain-containing protein n=1 Tax=Porphyridium purpureum TaxID=35688 RepID=A0A5J4YPE2_PORPP|nr:hypothetical protein FVE85_8623 [Porphyridium purpureum]|eukprot:POR7003..scf296_7